MSPVTRSASNKAIEDLLEAFERWQEEDDDAKEVDGVQDATGTSQNNDHDDIPIAIPTMPHPIIFLHSLPYVDPMELSDDRRDCGICLKTMHSISEKGQYTALDLATRMPCGHVLGFRCLYQWFNPCEGSNNNNCPYCRAVFFQKFADEDSLEGLTQRLNALEWDIITKKRRPEPGQRRRLCHFRLEIVHHLIHEASQKVEMNRHEIDTQLAPSSGMARATDAEYNTDSPDILLEYFFHQMVIQVIKSQLRVAQIQHDLDASQTPENEERASSTRLLQEG